MADELKTLQQLAYAEPNIGALDVIDAKVKGTAKAVGKKLWHGILAAATTGFGKGVILAGLAIIVAGAVLGGYFAATGALPMPTPTGMPVAATLEEGLVHGAAKGLNALFSSPLAWLTVAVGGAFGAASDVRRRQNEINAEIAQAEALQMEALRQKPAPGVAQAQTVQPPQPAREPSPQVVHVSYNPAATAVLHTHTQAQPDAGFAEREMNRRTETPATPAIGK
jgi:tetrahydromethanopterin S-methyltransferase subunit F